MIDQAVIIVAGMASIWLSQSPLVSSRRWAPVIGILAQPFWLWAAVKAGQWGIAALSIVYAFGWARGIRTYWITR